MNRQQRAAAVEEFSNPTGRTDIMLISLRAGGVGLNLTAASAVILIDPWWNPAIEDQAIDRYLYTKFHLFYREYIITYAFFRVHRLGQTRPVHVYRMICFDSVEEKLLELQERKRVLSSKVTGHSSHTAAQSSLSLEDLKGFFV
jgi:SNF2 family DNA or RNA helicase